MLRLSEPAEGHRYSDALGPILSPRSGVVSPSRRRQGEPAERRGQLRLCQPSQAGGAASSLRDDEVVVPSARGGASCLREGIFGRQRSIGSRRSGVVHSEGRLLHESSALQRRGIVSPSQCRRRSRRRRWRPRRGVVSPRHVMCDLARSQRSGIASPSRNPLPASLAVRARGAASSLRADPRVERGAKRSRRSGVVTPSSRSTSAKEPAERRRQLRAHDVPCSGQRSGVVAPR